MRRSLGLSLLGALALLAVACARPGGPTGGPRDQRPPVLVSVEPDTFARIEPGDGRIRIVFDETLSEQVQGGTMDDVVQVSPRTGDVRVSHSGNELEVEIEGGFQPGVVYRVTVLPRLVDRFSNRLLAPFEWVFSTGPDFEPTAFAGEVWDRVTGAPISDALVTALDGDSVPYVAVTDSAGLFAMRYLPSGAYRVTGLLDRDRDRVADAFEAQGSAPSIELGRTDTLLTSFALLVPDTTPPQLVQGEKIDSVTLRVIFDDPLDPAQDLRRFVRGMYRDSGDTPGVREVLHEWEYEERLDSIAAANGTDVADTVAVESEPEPEPMPDSLEIEPESRSFGARREAAAAAETQRTGQATGSRAAVAEDRDFLPNGERVPKPSLIFVLRGPIEGGFTYTVAYRAIANISGLVTDEGEGELRLAPDPEPEPVDSLALDSLAVDSLAPESLAPGSAAPDSAAPGSVPPDTVPPDTVSPDTVSPGPRPSDAREPRARRPRPSARDTLPPDTTAAGDPARPARPSRGP